MRWFCLNNLHHIPLYVERGLYFQSFDRLYNAYQEFLQALFIARRTYPIAYNKWIHEQIVEILGYRSSISDCRGCFEIRDFESAELVAKAEEVGASAGPVRAAADEQRLKSNRPSSRMGRRVIACRSIPIS